MNQLARFNLGKSGIAPSVLCLSFFLFAFLNACLPDKQAARPDPHPLMGMGYGIGSATILVDDADSALAYLEEILGFRTPGVERMGPTSFPETRSALIRMADMSGLEILALDDSATLGKPAFFSEGSHQASGVRMYSLSSSTVDTTHAWLTRQGFTTDSVIAFRASYKPSNGWGKGEGMYAEARSLDFDHTNPPAELPRFLEYVNLDYPLMHGNRESFYAFGRSFAQHPNGVVSTLALQILVEDLEAARERFTQMGFLEIEGNREDNLVRFHVTEKQELEIVAPDSQDDSLTQILQKRGPGVFGIRFEVSDLAATRDFFAEKLPAEALHMDTVRGRLLLSSEHALGVEMEFQEESEEQSLMAQQFKMGPKLDSVARNNAAAMYQQYCALCHGENREGYAADFAPSLRSHSLMASAMTSNFLRYTIQHGREGTAMGGYINSQGGPLKYIEVELLLKWLQEEAGVEEPIELSREPVQGDVALGAKVYEAHCAVCHGPEGEGISAPALGNPMLLATATDEFLKYAISEGRDGTPMVAFKDSLDEAEINGVTAFLRSRAAGWDVPQGDSIRIPTPEEYVLNPDGPNPEFQLKDGKYVPAAAVNQALADGAKMILLDARSTVAWRQTHIPGAIPVPYYEEPEAFVDDLPRDDTWIISYCACPHAASGRVLNTLRQHGFTKTAIIDEGILVWAKSGYPVEHGH